MAVPTVFYVAAFSVIFTANLVQFETDARSVKRQADVSAIINPTPIHKLPLLVSVPNHSGHEDEVLSKFEPRVGETHPKSRKGRQMTMISTALLSMGCLPQFFCGLNTKAPSQSSTMANDLAYLMKFAFSEEPDGQSRERIGAEDEEEEEEDHEPVKRDSQEDIGGLPPYRPPPRPRPPMRTHAMLEHQANTQLVEEDPSFLSYVWKDWLKMGKQKKKTDMKDMEYEKLLALYKKEKNKAEGGSSPLSIFSRFRIMRSYVDGTLQSQRKNVNRRARMGWKLGDPGVMRDPNYLYNKRMEIQAGASIERQLEIAADVGDKLRSDRDCQMLFNSCPYSFNELMSLVKNDTEGFSPLRPESVGPYQSTVYNKSPYFAFMSDGIYVEDSEDPETIRQIQMIQQQFTFTTPKPTTTTTRKPENKYDTSDQTAYLLLPEAIIDMQEHIELQEKHEELKEKIKLRPNSVEDDEMSETIPETLLPVSPIKAVSSKEVKKAVSTKKPKFKYTVRMKGSTTKIPERVQQDSAEIQKDIPKGSEENSRSAESSEEEGDDENENIGSIEVAPAASTESEENESSGEKNNVSKPKHSKKPKGQVPQPIDKVNEIPDDEVIFAIKESVRPMQQNVKGTYTVNKPKKDTVSSEESTEDDQVPDEPQVKLPPVYGGINSKAPEKAAVPTPAKPQENSNESENSDEESRENKKSEERHPPKRRPSLENIVQDNQKVVPHERPRPVGPIAELGDVVETPERIPPPPPVYHGRPQQERKPGLATSLWNKLKKAPVPAVRRHPIMAPRPTMAQFQNENTGATNRESKESKESDEKDSSEEVPNVNKLPIRERPKPEDDEADTPPEPKVTTYPVMDLPDIGSGPTFATLPPTDLPPPPPPVFNKWKVSAEYKRPKITKRPPPRPVVSNRVRPSPATMIKSHEMTQEIDLYEKSDEVGVDDSAPNSDQSGGHRIKNQENDSPEDEENNKGKSSEELFPVSKPGDDEDNSSEETKKNPEEELISSLGGGPNHEPAETNGPEVPPPPPLVNRWTPSSNLEIQISSTTKRPVHNLIDPVRNATEPTIPRPQPEKNDEKSEESDQQESDEKQSTEDDSPEDPKPESVSTKPFADAKPLEKDTSPEEKHDDSEAQEKPQESEEYDVPTEKIKTGEDDSNEEKKAQTNPGVENEPEETLADTEEKEESLESDEDKKSNEKDAETEDEEDKALDSSEEIMKFIKNAEREEEEEKEAEKDVATPVKSTIEVASLGTPVVTKPSGVPPPPPAVGGYDSNNAQAVPLSTTIRPTNKNNNGNNKNPSSTSPRPDDGDGDGDPKKSEEDDDDDEDNDSQSKEDNDKKDPGNTPDTNNGDSSEEDDQAETLAAVRRRKEEERRKTTTTAYPYPTTKRPFFNLFNKAPRAQQQRITPPGAQFFHRMSAAAGATNKPINRVATMFPRIVGVPTRRPVLIRKITRNKIVLKV